MHDALDGAVPAVGMHVPTPQVDAAALDEQVHQVREPVTLPHGPSTLKEGAGGLAAAAGGGGGIGAVVVVVVAFVGLVDEAEGLFFFYSGNGCSSLEVHQDFVKYVLWLSLIHI